jgi:hypothetical protein
MSLKGDCRKWQRCESFRKIKNCKGCNFPYLVQIIGSDKNKNLNFLIDEHFKNCSSKRRGPGGRIALDKPLKNLLMKEIPKLKELSHKDLRVTLPLRNKEKIDFTIKCDGAFRLNQRYFFLEVKGYSSDTNNVLSPIMAAQITKQITKYKNCNYFYVGVGDTRKNLISLPYVKWAESEKLIKFYGIVDVNKIINEIKKAG